MKKLLFLSLTLFLAYFPSAYAVNYVSFETNLTRVSLPMGATYGGDALMYINNPESERTFPANGIVCFGLWLPKDDPGTKNALAIALSAITAKKKVHVTVRDDKWAGSSTYFCQVHHIGLLDY